MRVRRCSSALIAYRPAPEPFPIAFLVLVLACVGALPAADDRRLRDRVPDARRRHRDDRRGGRSRRTCPAASRSSSSTTLIRSTRSRSCSSLTLVAWLLQRLADPTWQFRRGRLFRPLIVFTGFVVFGFVPRPSPAAATRASPSSRPGRCSTCSLVYFLVTNLLTTRRQYLRLAHAGDGRPSSIQSIFSLIVLPRPARRGAGDAGEPVRALGDDPHERAVRVPPRRRRCSSARGGCAGRRAAVDPGRLRLPAVAAPRGDGRPVRRHRHPARRPLPPPPAGVLVRRPDGRRHRRSASSLGDVERERRDRAAGAGRQDACCSPTSSPSADRSSDLYREIEAFNLWFTIRADPILGVGFGQQVPPAVPAARHQLLRVLGVHPAQLGAVDLDQDRLLRVRRRCCSCSRGPSSWAPGRR